MKTNIITFFLLLLFSCVGYSQKANIDKGNKYYKVQAYTDAINEYEKAIKKGDKSTELLQNLGNSYYFNGDLKKANEWYSEIFLIETPVEPEYYYRYSQTLKAVRQYEMANSYLERFYNLDNTDLRAKSYKSNKNYLDEILKNSGRYEIKNLDINKNGSDYGMAFYGDKFLFTSSREDKGFVIAKSKLNNQAYTNLYEVEKNTKGGFTEPIEFSKSINSKLHEDTPVFTKDLKTVYFTRNNFNKGKTGKSYENVILLKIYTATFEDGKWENIQEFPFNNNEYSVAHPALSPDDKTLYFVSNMSGTKGPSDIYKVSILGKNTYGRPENLTKINTEGRETFPFISSNNELYFASDGHLGLGGLDVFTVKLSDNGMVGDIINVGTPINSPMDDFAFIIDSKTKKGYFSSNRDGGKGDDDIYSFIENMPFNYSLKIRGIVKEKTTGNTISNFTVLIYDETGKEINKVQTNAFGKYSFEVEIGKKYLIKTIENGFHSEETSVLVTENSNTESFDFNLSKIIIKEKLIIKIGDDLSKKLKLDRIHFDKFNWSLRFDAEEQLAKLAKFLEQNQSICVDIRNHTDSRGKAPNNLELSNRRANTIMLYLVDKGIDAIRVSSRGLGESMLLNHCADNIRCSERDHEQNIRTEFIVIKK